VNRGNWSVIQGWLEADRDRAICIIGSGREWTLTLTHGRPLRLYGEWLGYATLASAVEKVAAFLVEAGTVQAKIPSRT
jgi:hypothetical protein